MRGLLPTGNTSSIPSGHLPRGIRGYPADVGNKELRQTRLRKLIDDEFEGNQSRFAARIDRQPDYVSRLLSAKKGMGEDLAREIEHKLQLKTGWLDQADTPKVAEDPPAYKPGKKYADLIARRAGSLDETVQLCVLNLLEAITADRKENGHGRHATKKAVKS